MSYRVIDREHYYRRDVFRHFSEDCKCSTSMTARVDVTELAAYSHATGTRFYLNFLYLLSKTLNAREDYRMGYLWQTDQLICYDVIHPTQYVFHEDTETCSPVYSHYCEDYESFYRAAEADLEQAKQSGAPQLVRRLLHLLALLRFPERRAAGRASVLCAHRELGAVPGRKRQAAHAGERPAQPRRGRWLSGGSGVPAAAAGDRRLLPPMKT